MSDLIDREYAIKRFCEDGTYLERHGVGMMTLCEAKQRAVDLIESFPSAQPQWIPCSERMPENGRRVLFQMTNGYIDVLRFNAKGITNHLVAWMPLPKPYGGESNGKN